MSEKSFGLHFTCELCKDEMFEAYAALKDPTTTAIVTLHGQGQSVEVLAYHLMDKCAMEKVYVCRTCHGAPVTT